MRLFCFVLQSVLSIVIISLSVLLQSFIYLKCNSYTKYTKTMIKKKKNENKNDYEYEC